MSCGRKGASPISLATKIRWSEVVIIVALLLVALSGGFAFGIGREKQEPAPGGFSPGAGSSVDYRQRIAEGEKVVAKDPGNRSAWVQLGNDYFDAELPLQAVDAYERALEIDPNDPEVLTDLGVSCRRMGWHDRAAEAFGKALKIDPDYEPALVNLGIVYAVDLRQPEKALKAWNRFLELNPTCAAAGQVRLWVEELKANPQAFSEER